MNGIRIVSQVLGVVLGLLACISSNLAGQEGEGERSSVPARVVLQDGPELMSKLLGTYVYSSQEELVGQVEDIVVRTSDWRVDYLLVRPAIGVPVARGVWLAVESEIVEMDRGVVLISLPVQVLMDAPSITEDAFMVMLEAEDRFPPVLQVHVSDGRAMEDAGRAFGGRDLPPSRVDPEDPDNPEPLIDPEDLADPEDLVDPEKVDPEKVDPEKVDPEKVDPEKMDPLEDLHR